jgi:hypothetical protein
MKLQIVKATTSFVCHIFIQNSTSTTGGGLTGLTNASSGLICYFMRAGGSASVSSTLNTISTLGTYAGSSTNSAFKEVDSTNMPGVYEFQPANNALATGANQVVFMLSGAANMAPVLLEIQLTNTDVNDGVHFGLTALPNAAANASNGLITAGTGTNQITLSSGNVTAASVTGNVGGNVVGSVASVTAAVTVDMTQAVATSNTANTHGDCLNAARAGAFGKWTLSGTTYNLYAPDNSTVVKSFTLNSATTPTSRV